MAFYNVGGWLVRQTPNRRGICLEVWNGRDWRPYADVEEVLRHGDHLPAARALDLLCETRGKIQDAEPWSAKEARTVLRAPAKRV
jgi:hypothetical protein